MESFSFQPLLDRLTHVAVKTGVLRDFAKLKTSPEKIEFCWNTEVTYQEIVINYKKEIQQILEVLYRQCPDHGKSETLATQAKEKGSKAYLKKKDKEAHLNYTDCLRFAPDDSSVLPLAYGNRSAVLFQMERYKEALKDMDQAEKHGYPDSILHKLLARRCSCYIMLGERDQAEQSLNACKKHLCVISCEAKEKYEKTVSDLEEKIRNMHLIDSDSPTDDIELPNLFQGESPKVAYMSNALEMRVNELYGRHVTATEKICKGSVVFCEKPYAAILLPEHHLTHCHNCFSPAVNPLPCRACQDVVFCKEECRERSLLWHQHECRIFHILSAVGIAHLALRVIFVTGWKLFCQISNEDHNEKVAGVGSDNKYNGRSPTEGYRAVFHLMPHLHNSCPEDQLQYCLAAVLLASVVLDKTSFSEKNTLEVDNDNSNSKYLDINVVNLSTAIMRHIAQLVGNAHAITQVMTENCGESTVLEEITQKRIASAIYPTASLMNHSCQPTIINSFLSDMLVIRTIQDVKPDEQIYNCYGPHFCRQTRQERQESLKLQYFFTCKCVACTQPNYELREVAWNGFHCECCGGVASWNGEDDSSYDAASNTKDFLTCYECHKEAKPSERFVQICTKVNELEEEAEEALQIGDPHTAVTKLRKAIPLGSKVYRAENLYFVTLQDRLAKTLGATGDFEGCCQELRKCIRVSELRYGSDSIEYAHELLKFSDVLALASASSDRFREERRTVSASIDKIFNVNYGPHWKKYLKLEV